MRTTLPANAVNCGPDLVGFRDSAGEITHVRRDELNDELLELYSDPEALRVFNQSVEDFRDGRFVDFVF